MKVEHELFVIESEDGHLLSVHEEGFDVFTTREEALDTLADIGDDSLRIVRFERCLEVPRLMA